jgi:hypothetical protein
MPGLSKGNCAPQNALVDEGMSGRIIILLAYCTDVNRREYECAEQRFVAGIFPRPSNTCAFIGPRKGYDTAGTTDRTAHPGGGEINGRSTPWVSIRTGSHSTTTGLVLCNRRATLALKIWKLAESRVIGFSPTRATPVACPDDLSNSACAQILSLRFKK